jgi:alpha-beta hydrolase superfamily lysophospholipase
MKKDKVIVFIHGLHENALSWSNWVRFFEQAGYTCYSPNYPYHEGIPAQLRQNPDSKLAHVRLRNVVDYYAKFIDGLNANKPILIGHSMGGLIVQKLIENDKGLLGICIASASPKGVLSFKMSFIKSNIGAVNPFKGNSLFCGTKKWFHYAICNTLSREQSDEIYEKAVVPESRNIPRSSRGKDGKVNFKKAHNPLLFISAEKDHIIPLSLNKKNLSAYTNTESRRDFKEFKGRSHSICVDHGWEEVAKYADDWIKAVLSQ